MANYGYVKTKLPMDYCTLVCLIKELNRKNFKKAVTLQVYDTDPEKDKDPVEITVFYKDIYSCRVWLKGPKSCVIEHGGGSTGAWWADTLIRHTIAQRFCGAITDDGWDAIIPTDPSSYKTYRSYLTKKFGKDWKKRFGFLLDEE